VCVRDTNERENICVCVREIMRERETKCVSVRGQLGVCERESVRCVWCVREKVCVRERESVCV